MNTAPNDFRRTWLPDGLAVAAWLAALAVRAWGAWAMRCLTEPDPAVVALMARHMAALKEFPVFFYGQAYMGSLEPMASALMVRLLGYSGFAVNLGPVLFAAAALAVLWRWGRTAAGPWGGLAVVLAGLFGPVVFFQFQMAPRGGYMAALFIESLALLAAAKLAARLRHGEKVGSGSFLGMGLLAGVGLWSNMIVVPALAAAALMLAHGLRWNLLRHAPKLLAGAAGTLLGLAPWLAYNLRHGWASLGMTGGDGREPLRQAMHSTWERFALLNGGGMEIAGLPLGPILAGTVLGLAALGVWVLWRQRGSLGLTARYAGWGAVLFVWSFAGVFATSGFTRMPSARYWVPVVPGLAVLAGIACGGPGARLRRAVAWALLLGLAGVQGWQAVEGLRPHAERAPTCLATYDEIATALESTGADALFAPIQLYALNVALDERIPVSNGKQRFYEPILCAAELAEAPAYTSDFNGIESFLRQRGARWDSVSVARRRILWNVRLPDLGGAELQKDAVGSLRDGTGIDCRGVLTDRNLDTVWSPGTGEESVLEWVFSGPCGVEAVELVFAHGMADEAFTFPRRVRIEIKEDGEWRTVLAGEPVVPLEVSGPMVYFPSGLARMAYRVGAEKAEGLRVAFLDTREQTGRVGWRLAEAVLRVPNETALEDTLSVPPDSLGEVKAWISQFPADALVYAPRRLSNRLLKNGAVPRERLPGLAARIFGEPAGMPRDGAVDPERTCLFFVEPRQADATRATIEEQSRAYREAMTGEWAVFAVEPGMWDVGGLGLPPAVQWTGEALLAGQSKTRVGKALDKIRSGEGNEGQRRAWLGEVIRWRPSALSALPEKQVRELGGEEAVQLRAKAAAVPARPCPTEFANGIRLEGVEAEPVRVTPGGTVEVRLYWSASGNFTPGRELIFLHARDADGQMVAQDDYRGSPLLWGAPAVRPLPGEVVGETRLLRIPEDIAPGPLSLSVGLYVPGRGRAGVKDSRAPTVHRRAACWPAAVYVVR